MARAATAFNMSRALPKAILFDMDDTILDSSSAMDEAWSAVCEAVAPALDGPVAQALLEAMRKERRWFFSDPNRHRRGRLDPNTALVELCSGALARVGVEDPAVAVEMSERFTAQRVRMTRPFDGALEALRRLLDEGVRLALVTNGSARIQRAKIERLGLEQYFHHVQIEEEFGAGKPERHVYLHALSRVSAEPDQAWMVGDNLEWEVEAPQRLGMIGIWVDTHGDGLPDGTDIRPDRIVRSIMELP